MSIFPYKFSKNFNFTKKLTFPGKFPGKNWPFTATSGQIILFVFKSHHFRTYFLYTIRYNNISRPVHDHPYSPLPKLWGSRPPQLPRIDVPDRKVCAMTVTPTPTNTLLTIHQNITRLASADWRPKISF